MLACELNDLAYKLLLIWTHEEHTGPAKDRPPFSKFNMLHKWRKKPEALLMSWVSSGCHRLCAHASEITDMPFNKQ